MKKQKKAIPLKTPAKLAAALARCRGQIAPRLLDTTADIQAFVEAKRQRGPSSAAGGGKLLVERYFKYWTERQQSA